MDVSHMHGEGHFSIFLYKHCDVWINFWPLQKFKSNHLPSSRIFILEKWRMGAAIPNLSTKHFEIKIFRYLTKNAAFEVFFVFGHSVSCQRKPHGDLKKYCSWDGMSIIRWVYVGLLQHNCYIPWKFNNTLLVGWASINHYCKMFGEWFWMDDPKVPYVG